MSYWSENETAVEEICATCKETLEDHGTGVCICGHNCSDLMPGRILIACDAAGCDPHPFARETRELCPNGSGEVFRRREPNDGH